MLNKSNHEVYQELSKEQLIELLKLYGRLALTIDGLWFMGVEKSQDLPEAIKLDVEVWRQFGKSEGKLLKRFLSIDNVSTFEEICKIYLLTSIFGNLGAKVEIHEEKCYLIVTECHPQKARIRNNLGEFPCKDVGIAYFEGILKELNPKINFKCIVCPPDEHSEHIWCKWEVWFDND